MPRQLQQPRGQCHIGAHQLHVGGRGGHWHVSITLVVLGLLYHSLQKHILNSKTFFAKRFAPWLLGASNNFNKTSPPSAREAAMSVMQHKTFLKHLESFLEISMKPSGNTLETFSLKRLSSNSLETSFRHP